MNFIIEDVEQKYPNEMDSIPDNIRKYVETLCLNKNASIEVKTSIQISIMPMQTQTQSQTQTQTQTQTNDEKETCLNLKTPTQPKIAKGIKTLLVRNLPRTIHTDILYSIFEKFGPIRDVYIPMNRDTTSRYYGTIKGFALIKFTSYEHSLLAYLTLFNKLVIDNKDIHIEFAKEDRDA
jgi:hypothetical protein